MRGSLPGGRSEIYIKKFEIRYNHSIFLETSRTRAYPNRLNWRCENLLTRNRDIIEGKRILDLGSHDGRFSYACLRLGADHVTGLEGRPELVNHANNNLLRLNCRSETFDFIAGDAFDFLPKYTVGQFHTVLCLGFFYHTIRQVEFLNEIKRLKPRHIILDTHVAQDGFWTKLDFLLSAKNDRNRLKPAYLYFRQEKHDRPDSTGSTIDPIGIIAMPTKSLIELLLNSYGFQATEIKWKDAGITDWHKLKDYKRGKRVSYRITAR